MRKAALATAAVGVSGTILGKSAIPESVAKSASPASCATYCDIESKACIVVDSCGGNRGCFSGCFSLYSLSSLISFGKQTTICIAGCKVLQNAGQAIGSAQRACAPNRYGLDFYTSYKKRMSITCKGIVGVNTCTPNSSVQMQVCGPFVAQTAKAPAAAVHGNNTGGAGGVGVLAQSGACGIPLIAEGAASQKVNLQNWQKCSTIKSVVNSCGWFGIGTSTPHSSLCVVGSTNTAISGYSTCEAGVYGQSCSTAVCAVAVEGVIKSSCPGIGSAAVRGINNGKGSFGSGVFGSQAGSGFGVLGFAPCGTGVVGCAPGGTGVFGFSAGTSGPGVSGFNSASGGIGVEGSNGASGGIGVEGRACNAGAIPIVAKGFSGQTANLQQWENSCGTVYAVINKAGSLGLGGVTNPHHVLCISGKAHASSGFSIGPCVCINTTLAVNGSFAAKTRTVGSTTTLLTTDYAILATGTITLTLPPAKTQNGMMIFIKNTSTSTVSVVSGGTDTIEGSSTARTLTKQYDSLTLISNGSNEWFIQSGAKCGAFVS